MATTTSASAAAGGYDDFHDWDGADLVAGGKRTEKAIYMRKLVTLLDESHAVLLVDFTGLSNKTTKGLSLALRELGAVIKGGKNTLMRKALGDKHPLHRFIYGNVALVCCRSLVTPVLSAIGSAEERRGPVLDEVLPHDVILPMGPTESPPRDTALFQALEIMTKINRGKVEVLAPKLLGRTGDRVSPALAALSRVVPSLATCIVKRPLVALVYENGTLTTPPLMMLQPTVIPEDDVEATALVERVLPTGCGALGAILAAVLAVSLVRGVQLIQKDVEERRKMDAEGAKGEEADHKEGDPDDPETDPDEPDGPMSDIFGGLDDDW